MSYQKPGFYEVPLGRLLPGWCASITASGNWERDLADTMDNLGRSGRRVNTLGLEDIVSLKGVGIFVENGPAHRALSHVLCRFLHSLGVMERYPRVIGYTSEPYLTIDDGLDRMLTAYSRFPSMDTLGGKEQFNLEALKGILPSVIRELRFMQNLRPIFLARLRLKLGQIAFKLATGSPIDQAERSFFVNMSDPDSPYAMTREEARTANLAPRPPITVSDTGDPLVSEAWEAWKACTEAGPFLRFIKLESNMSLENLVYWYGPQQASLSYGLGFNFGYGRYFDEPRVREAAVVQWTSQDQMVAARERNVAFKVQDSVSAIRLPVLAAVATGKAPDPTWDLPDVDIRVNLDQGDVVPAEYSYWSGWRERPMSTRLGASPQTFLHDLALRNQTLGEAQSTGNSIQAWDLIDMQMSEEYLGSQRPWTPDYREEIHTPGKLGRLGRLTSVASVDMSDHYKRLGTLMFPPAFREYVMCPLSWLYVPDPEAEAFIAARLGLTWEEKQHAERVIRVSHNYSKLRRLFAEAQLPIDKNRLGSLCSALLGR